MGLFAFLAARKPSRRLSIGDSPARCRAAIETLEQRVFLTTVVQLNSPGLDVSGTVAGGVRHVDLAAQSETTNVTFSPPASNDRTVVAYNDGAMARFGEASGSAMHTTGWAYSDNGGASVVQPNSNPTDPALLPTISDGARITGDEFNHSLAWDNANGTLYRAGQRGRGPKSHFVLDLLTKWIARQGAADGVDGQGATTSSIGLSSNIVLLLTLLLTRRHANRRTL